MELFWNLELGTWNFFGHGHAFCDSTFSWTSYAQQPTGVRPGQVQRGGAGGARTAGGGAGTSSSGGRQYTPNGMVGEAMVTSDPETRRLIVITDDETSEYISQVITNLDRPKPQVLIKVVFLEVTYRNTLDVGLEGSIRKRIAGGTDFAVSNLFSLASAGSAFPPGTGMYQILGNDLEVTLRAIANAGKTEVLSRPSILARNNQQAVITVGSELPFITASSFTSLGQQINTVQYQDIGIILRVTPFITDGGMVEMIVAPEISTLTDRTVQIAANVNAPVISKRAADTVVVTPDGQTIIIGGLMENNKLSSDSKIPFLSDIPLLGNLFKRKTRDDTKTELIIFLTPHIVKEPAQLADLSAREKEKAMIAPKAFSEEELNRFLDGVPSKNQGQGNGSDQQRNRH